MSLKSTLMALGIMSLVSLFGSHSALAESTATADSQSKDAPKSVVVKVQANDTLSSIAQEHGTDYVRLFNANAGIANPDVIDVDDEIRIPATDEQLPDRYGEFMAGQQAPAAAPASTAQATATAAAAAPATPVAAPAVAQNSSGNTYAYGWCTWYVKSRKPNIPNTWGNASQWLGNAQASGYGTGSAPVAGAIGVAGGHVVYVESVSGGNVSISEMAYAGGIGVVHYRTVPASSFYYIYA